MIGQRWRLVSEQAGGAPYVSTIVLSADEVADQLDGEAYLHSITGWAVTRGDNVVVCRKTVGPRVGLVRTISAVAFGPMDDAP